MKYFFHFTNFLVANTPGMLEPAKKLIRNKIPHGGGSGGSVFLVSNENYRFLAEPEKREEPGTPDLDMTQHTLTVPRL